MQIEIKIDGKLVMAGQLTERGKDRPFSTGSRGYQFVTADKPVIGDHKYQPSITFVEIGSKPAKAAAKVA